MKYFLIMIIVTLCIPTYGAEFLIYNKDHWMTKLTLDEMKIYREKYKDWDERVAGQYQKGDIIEVRPDGFWTGLKVRGFNKKAFRVLSVPGLSIKTAQKYKIITPTRKSRYNISTGADKELKIVNNINDVSITDKELIIANSHISTIVAILVLLNISS